MKVIKVSDMLRLESVHDIKNYITKTGVKKCKRHSFYVVELDTGCQTLIIQIGNKKYSYMDTLLPETIEKILPTIEMLNGFSLAELCDAIPEIENVCKDSLWEDFWV